MNVLSLFDGMSCGQIALNRAGIKYNKYYSSEIDKYCISITQKNYPLTIQLGDITKINNSYFPIDLLIGGSPCQGFSTAGKGLNFNDTRSKLFFEYVRLLKKLKPKYFLLENVKMKKEYQDIISEILNVTPIEINSSLVSAQNRRRLYWTNIKNILHPEDKKIMLKDIILNGLVDRDKSYCIDSNYFKGTNVRQYYDNARRQVVFKIPEATKKGFIEVSNGDFADITFLKSKTRRGRSMKNKSNCLTATSFKYCKITNNWFRLLTPVECERLQTVPDDYTNGVSSSQRYKMLGNGWTVDVIVHILNNLKG